MSERLGTFLHEVSNWHWDEFAKAEHDTQYTSNQAMIFALIRSCAMQKMDAIRMSLNRLDGKLKTPIRVEAPKVFYLFPNAKLPEGARVEQPKLPNGELGHEVVTRYEKQEIAESELEDLPSLSLRQTLTKMADYPREIPEMVADAALQTEQWLNKQAPQPKEIPLVKSVVAAHLLILAQSRDIGALTEVFDQIDGKLVETIQLIGEDIYITSYAAIAPPEAILNKDGVLQMEAVQAQTLWAQKLGAITNA